jgi:hypothetical protein
MEHWEEEKGLLETWCRLVGLAPGEYTIRKPSHSILGIEIQFTRSLDLDPLPSEEPPMPIEPPPPPAQSPSRPNTWARIWVSNKYGGRISFPRDYDLLKKEAEEAGKPLTSFELLSQLREKLASEEGQTRWKEWYERVQRENGAAPNSPPVLPATSS